MFIKKLYKEIEKRIQDDNGFSYREANIGWPSEALSDLGPFNIGECKRALFYKIMGIPCSRGMSPRVRKICDAGIMYEEAAIKNFKNTLYHVESQIRIQYEMPNTINKVQLSGKLDEVIKDGIKKGIEIKTVYGYKAKSVFGADNKEPLPACDNLMQVMLYKHEAKKNNINGHKIEEMYLMYINREDGCEIYYKIDMDDEGYAIITPIDMEGNEMPTINVKDYPSYENLLNRPTTASSDDSRKAELRINVNDIFKKFDNTFSNARASMLPDKDYNLIYTKEQLDKEYHCGRISKLKYNKHNKGELAGDFKCAYCNYKNKCLEDEGIRLK